MKRLTMAMLGTIVIISIILIACSSDDDATAPPQTTAPTQTTQEPQEDVTLNIGMITDKSGGGAAVMSIVDDGVEDIVEYYNDNNLIPGVTVKVNSYDNEYDPAKEVPAYNYLKSRGADLMIGNMPNSAVILKPRFEADKMLFFSQSYTEEGFYPPGYSFSLNVHTDRLVPTMLQWIAENDPDFPQDRPAKIGGVNWDEPLSRSIFDACEAYAKTHPDQFRWVGHYLTERVFTWDVQVEGLKDCDYLMPPMAGLVTFAKQYRENGYKGKFFGTDGHAAFMGLIESARLWDELDGMYFGLPVGFWTDDTEPVNLAKDYVNGKNDPGKYYDAGTSYLGPFVSYKGVLDIIAETASEVGPQNLNTEAIYKKAQSFTTEINGNQFAFSTTERNAFSSFGMYQLQAEDKNLFRIVPDWLPVLDGE